MAFDFPNAPTVGQVYQGWVWDGEKWKNQTTSAVGAVRYDVAQGLTTTQQVQGRQNIYAAPLDALSYSGLQINGSMEVSQENGNAQVSLANGGALYIIDQWLAQYQNASAVVRASGANPPNSPGPFGLAFTSVLTMQATTAFGTAAASDIARLFQYVEGYRWSRLGFGNASAQPVTIGFWIYASIAGNASVAVVNNAANRSYVVDVAVNSPLTWEWKTVTIPGCTDGTWLTTNGIGAIVNIGLGCGTTFQTPTPATWQTGQFFSTVNSTRFFTTANNFVQITGVVILPGTEAPSAARSPLIMRPFDQELTLCKRYWQIVPYHMYIATAAAGQTAVNTLTFTEMRIAPSPITDVPVINTNFLTKVVASQGPIGLFTYANTSAAGYSELAGTFKLNARL